MVNFLLSFTALSAYVLSAVAYDSKFVLNTGIRYVKLCGAAYCTDQSLKRNTVNDWSCSACKSFPNMKNPVSFHGDGYTDANGFVGYDADAKEIVVSFSGTNPLSMQNWIDDIDTVKEDYPYCSGCEVHQGFYRAYKSVDSQVKSLVNNLLKSYPNTTIAITGHSLGAAMAAHCSAEFVHSGYNIKTTYSYGMPRVGNQAFEQWYVTVVPGTFRVVHRKDPVPHLPYERWGFHHMPYEVFYLEDMNKWKLCSFDGEDKSCSDQYDLDLDVENHLHYLDFDFTTNYLSCEL